MDLFHITIDSTTYRTRVPDLIKSSKYYSFSNSRSKHVRTVCFFDSDPCLFFAFMFVQHISMCYRQIT
jgi:hypothetical protein